MFNKTAILYSFEQKSFHTETLLDYIKSNIICSKKKIHNQFRLVGITDDYESATLLITELRKNNNWL